MVMQLGKAKYLNFMFIEHINPFLWYKFLKTSQKMSTLSTDLWSKQKSKLFVKTLHDKQMTGQDSFT